MWLYWTLVKRPCPGPTGYCTPVLGRRVGRTQMEESKTLGSESLNSINNYEQNTKANEGAIISNWYLRLRFIE